MCRWMGSQFHDWIDSYEVAFSIELLEWGRTFSGFRRYENSGRWDLNIGRFAIKRRYRWDRKNYIRPKMESIMGPRIDHSGVRVLRGQRHKVKIDSLTPPPPDHGKVQHQICRPQHFTHDQTTVHMQVTLLYFFASFSATKKKYHEKPILFSSFPFPFLTVSIYKYRNPRHSALLK